MGKSERILILEEDLRHYVKVLGEASRIIIDQDITKYPIFVVHQDEINIGVVTIEKEKVGGNWNINSSSLEEFVTKNIIHEDKVNEFIENFKNTNAYVCLFVLSELGANFIFMPYGE